MKNPLLVASIAFALGLSLGTLATDEHIGSRDAQRPGVFSKQTMRDNSTEDGSHDAEVLVSNIALAGESSSKSGNVDPHPTAVESDSIDEFLKRSKQLESELTRLSQRVDSIELQLYTWQSKPVGDGTAESSSGDDSASFANTPENELTVLVAAGVSETLAEDIIWRQSSLELKRLELRDQAIRGGWLESDRYREAVRELNDQAVDMRAEISEQAYDQYLYNMGVPNRVRVSAVIQGSAAEQSGLLPGDIIETYGEARIFDFSDLRTATTQGARGDSVPVLIRRGDQLLEATIERGPMGVRLDTTSSLPDD